MDKDLGALTTYLAHSDHIKWSELPDLQISHCGPEDVLHDAQNQPVRCLNFGEGKHLGQTIPQQTSAAERHEQPQQCSWSFDIPVQNYIQAFNAVQRSASSQDLHQLNYGLLGLTEESQFFSDIAPNFSAARPHLVRKELPTAEQAAKVDATIHSRWQDDSNEHNYSICESEELPTPEKQHGNVLEMKMKKPTDRITTRRFISPKVTESYVHQFRVHKAASSQPSNRRKRQAIAAENEPSKVVAKSADSGNRKICIHCHFLNKKCVASTENLPRESLAGPFDSINYAQLRCTNCAEPRFSRQLFCRIQMELLLPKFLFRESGIILANPEAALSIGNRVLSGDFQSTMGTALEISRSDFWFKIPFHKLLAVGDEDLDQINVLYRASLPILPNLGMIKRQTKLLIGFAEDFLKERPPKWQLVLSAFEFVKIGYCLFQTISKDTKRSAPDLPVADLENRKQQIASLAHHFTNETRKFIEILDCALHKKPTTTDWAAIVTSVALIFDMFQYMFYLLQKGYLEFDISDLRRFRGILFTRYSLWGGLRLLDNEELLRRDSRLHQYYRSYTDYWRGTNALKVYETGRPVLPAKTSEIGLRYSNAVPLPLPLHVVQTGYCRTATSFTCENRRDRAMCSGCFMKMMDRIYPKPVTVS